MPTDQMWKAPGVAEWLNVPTHRIYSLVRTGRIPHVRIGRQVRFDPERLREWLDAGGTTAADDGDDAA